MYIVLEGVDTVGKSTQVSLLRNVYKNAIFMREPTNTNFGNRIRDLALNYNINNISQTLLFMADRANNAENIRNNLSLAKLVISDRSFISGVAYGVDLDLDFLLEMNKKIAPLPNLVVVLHAKENILKKRMNEKYLDSIESNGINYLLSVQNRILKIVKILGIESITIDCNQNENKILKSIINKIDSML